MEMNILDEGTEGIELDKPQETRAAANVGKFRRWFRAAIEASDDWRKEAREDYDFVSGDQWSEQDKQAFKDANRPSIVINRIKPLINVLSGYQRLNRYDIEFLPRSGDDVDLCQVRKGITKYIMDSCDYDRHESDAFMDAAIGGMGWLEVGYKYDPEMDDGDAYVVRADPFGIYVDPEAHASNFSDAKFICRAKWVDKAELKDTYPEHAAEIDACCTLYDSAERENDSASEIDPTWYQSDLKKIRIVDCWYKERTKKTFFYLQDGQRLSQEEMQIEHFLQGIVAGTKTIPTTEVRVCTFFDRVLLEDIASPYNHGELPFVPIVCYHYGVGDLPAGFVRDLKDPQREINRRRIQMLHILNTSGNGGGWIEDDAMTPEQEASFRANGNKPGYFSKVRPGTIAQGKIQERQMQQIPAAVIQAEVSATMDLSSISGINEALMGTDIKTGESGRAIQLRQKQAITHIAPMFDSLRAAKKRIAYQLWGKRGHPGIIPEFYNTEKVFRIEGQNGQRFVPVNQLIQTQDPLGNVINTTLNDLSQGEFDIVVSDVEASTTQRQAQLWGLVDSVSKLGIPGDMVFDTIIELSDLPNKQELKQRWQERQQSQAQQAQAQMELERIKNENLRQDINFRDAPIPIQMAMAAKQGLIDQQVADYFIKTMLEQMAPELAQQMEMQQQQAQQQQMMAQEQQAQMLAQAQQQQAAQQAAQQGQGSSTMTQAGMEAMLAGQSPGAI